jgi:hypothetical protein
MVKLGKSSYDVRKFTRSLRPEEKAYFGAKRKRNLFVFQCPWRRYEDILRMEDLSYVGYAEIAGFSSS